MNPEKGAGARGSLRPLGFIALVVVAGGALPFVGPPVLNWFDVQIELQSTPPPRRPALPPAAQPVAVYGHGGARVTEWKWVVCEERAPLRYACRVYGENDRLEVVGDYQAHAGRYRRRDGRLPHPGEALQYAYLEDAATILLTSPPGGKLLARGLLLFPVSGTKATVVDEQGRLSEETPMSAEERAAVPR